MLQRVEKVAQGAERRRIEALVAREEARVRRAFRQFLDETTSRPVLRQVRRVLQAGDVEAALRLADAHVLRLGSVIPRVFQEAGAAESEALARQLGAGAAAVAVSFDPTFPRAANLMRRNRLQFVREFTAAQREVTRAALTEALQTGAGPIRAARAFRDSIGLTERQRRAVENYRRLLELGDAEALERGLRDRRFDPSVRRAAETGEPLGARRIDRMVAQYRNRFRQFRAETIARTETQRVANDARQEALSQTLEEVGIGDDKVVRTWRATLDARTRDTHISMSGQQRGMRQPFLSPSGAQLLHPGDGSLGAPAGEIVNCRCVVVVEVKS